MTQSQPQENIKITLIGGTGVGKTCIIKRLTDGSFDPDSNSTMGGSYSVKMLKIDQEEVKCDIWDTAGQEKYRSLGQLFYKDAYIVCLVYSINNKKTFEDMKEKWYPDLKQYGEKYQVLGVVANKSDMFEEEEVNEDEGRQYAATINAKFFLVSAKTGDGIDAMFKALVQEYLGPDFKKKVKEMKEEKGEVQKLDDKDFKHTVEKKKKKCC